MKLDKDQLKRHIHKSDLTAIEKRYLEGLVDGTRWIPVSERLPEGMQEVLVFTEKLQMKKALYNCAYKSFDELSQNGYRKIGNVSHWMPLPEPPEV